MLGLGWGEIFLVLVLALVVIGPKHLPEAAKTLGKTWAGLRRAFDEATGEIREEFREVDQQITRARQEVRSGISLEPPSETEPKAPVPTDEVSADADLAEFVGEVTGEGAPPEGGEKA